MVYGFYKMNFKMEKEYVVLVDSEDTEIGVMDKIQAHKEGKLHRAISVLIFNSKQQLLLQKRAAIKYHSPGLWSNTCCSHPRQNEKNHQAASRRLKEEMGLDCHLNFLFNLTYKLNLEDNLIEHEYDYIYVGQSDTLPNPDSKEVSEWRYEDIQSIEREIKLNPHAFTPWFKLIMEQFKTR